MRVSFLPAQESDAAISFVAAKRLGNAVYRNRCRRRLRAAAQEVGAWEKGLDMIVFATPSTQNALFFELVSTFRAFLDKMEGAQ